LARYGNETELRGPSVASGVYGRFAKHYDLLYGDLNYAGDCDFLEAAFRKFRSPPPESVLDLGCGTGTHAILLARRGYEVVGLDRSPSQLAVARAKARGRGLSVSFVRGDMRRFSLGQSFDAAICMFGGFGYILPDREVTGHFRQVRRHLRPGGAYAFEFWQESGVIPGRRGWALKDTPYRLIRLDESRFDPKRHRLSFDMHFFAFRGDRLRERFTESHTVRVYRVEEVAALLARSGLRLAGAYAGDGERKGFARVRKGTFRVMAFAMRPA